MPPINQQGSRAGLITALVVFVILFVTATIFSFQFYGNWQKVQANYTAYQNNYKDIVPLGQLQQPLVTDLQAARSEQPNKFGLNSSDSVLDVALKERDSLAGTITGSATAAPAVAADQAANSLKDAQSTLEKSGVKISVAGSGLSKAVTTLAAALAQSQQTIGTLTDNLRDANASLATAKDDVSKATDQGNQNLKDAQAKAATDLATANAAVDASKAVVTQMQADQAAAAKAASDAAAAKDTELAGVNQQLTKANSMIQSLQGRLANRRVDVTNAAVRQVDGKLIRVPNNDICYINLGEGDQVTPGLTFEVYDKSEGVPPIPANVTGDEQLPVGKASIEITHVGTTSSECRIVHIEPGAVLSEGDPIENLVYDPHTKYNFFVYGNFDLANSGRPNPADAEVIKRLVTQWGGKLTDQLDVDTDFVVLGAEPVLPNFSKDDLTAENQDKLAKAQEALDKYQELLAQAKDLHIPIMNQNRFLYYVGFYDQAKR
jgi:hypothetical protein